GGGGGAAEGAGRDRVEAPPAPALHMLHRAPRDVGRADQVDAEGGLPLLLPVLIVHMGERLRLEDPRVVDQDVKPAEQFGSAVYHGADRVWIGEVGPNDYVPGPREAGGQVVGEPGRVAMMNCYPVTCAG